MFVAMNKGILISILVLPFYLQSCSAPSTIQKSEIICGAEQLEKLLPLIREKNVALLVNQTSVVGLTHLVDTLLTYNIKVKKIFAPEHGFRGSADAGEHVRDADGATRHAARKPRRLHWQASRPDGSYKYEVTFEIREGRGCPALDLDN